jgi:hypothetical protein
MWIAGIVLLLLATTAVSLLLAQRPSGSAPEIWDIPGTARTYTTIVGTLAGFSVTSSVFIANLTAARQSDNFENVIALFLVAFLVFISSAMQFGTTPNLGLQTADYRAVQGYSYLLANASFYLGLCLSWLGLPLLLAAIGLDYLSDIFIWLVLFAILGGAMRVSSSGLNIFANMDLLPSLCLPLLCFAAALIYWLVASQLLESLLPDKHGPVLFAVICFGIAALGFSIQSAIVGSLRSGESARSMRLAGRRVAVGLAGAVFTVVSLLWLSVISEL